MARKYYVELDFIINRLDDVISRVNDPSNCNTFDSAHSVIYVIEVLKEELLEYLEEQEYGKD